MKRVVIVVIGLMLTVPPLAPAAQEQWTQFRGPSAGDIPR